MTFIATDANYNTYIYAVKPYRGSQWWFANELWTDKVQISRTTAFRLTGRHILWQDEPVEVT